MVAADHVDTAIRQLGGAVIVGLTVGLPLWWSSRHGRKKLSEQVGATPTKEDGKPTSIATELAEFKGEMREHGRVTDERLDRLDRGHNELRGGQVEMTNALAQVTGTLGQLADKVDELNELHRTEPEGS